MRQVGGVCGAVDASPIAIQQATNALRRHDYTALLCADARGGVIANGQALYLQVLYATFAASKRVAASRMQARTSCRCLVKVTR